MRWLAARQSAFGTAAQVLPKLKQVLTNLSPTWHLRELSDLDATFVGRNRISGLIWDVDGTLTIHHADQIAAERRVAYSALTQLSQLSHAVLSNAGEHRFRELSRIFPEVPIHKGYLVGNQLTLRTRIGNCDSWNERELERRLASGAIPVRKPDAGLVALVIAAMERPAAEVVMVGDQYLTDIAGANLAGIRSIKLSTLARAQFPLAVRLAQHAEDLLYRLQHGVPVMEGPDAKVATVREGVNRSGA